MDSSLFHGEGDFEGDNAEAEVGRIIIDGLELQISFDHLPLMKRDGIVYITGYFLQPANMKDGLHKATGIIISTPSQTRFAEIPVSLLGRADINNKRYQDTMHLIELVQSKAVRMNDDPSGPRL